MKVNKAQEKSAQVPGNSSVGSKSSMGKVLIFIIVILISLVSGYILRMVTEPDPISQEKTVLSQVLPSPAISKSAVSESPAENIPTDILISQPQAKLTQTLGYKTQNNVYMLKAPAGWTLKQENENNNTIVTISDGRNDLIIKALDATEGVPCVFPDAPFPTSEMFPDVSQYSYSKYGEFTGHEETIFRRTDITANPSTGKSTFVVCQRRENQFSQPTLFGFVTYEIPYSDNPEVVSAGTLETLDQIFGSVRPQV